MLAFKVVRAQLVVLSRSTVVLLPAYLPFFAPFVQLRRSGEAFSLEVRGNTCGSDLGADRRDRGKADDVQESRIEREKGNGETRSDGRGNSRRGEYGFGGVRGVGKQREDGRFNTSDH